MKKRKGKYYCHTLYVKMVAEPIYETRMRHLFLLLQLCFKVSLLMYLYEEWYGF